MWTIHTDKNWSALRKEFDWIQAMEGVPQSPIFHAEGDVAIHTKMVMEALIGLPEFEQLTREEQETLFAAALLHDVEKRSCTTVAADGQIRSPGHARRGMYTARTLLYQTIPAPFLQREQIVRLVRYHGLPVWIFDKPAPQRVLYQVSQEVNTKLLYLLSKADMLGRICPDQQELLYQVDLFKAFCEEEACWGQAKAFASTFGRYAFFCGHSESPDYQPFEAKTFPVIMVSGLPGSGKDHFINQYNKDWPVISLDQLRRKHQVLPKDKKGNGRIIQLAKSQAKTYLRAKKPFIWNATNITQNMRSQLIQLFQTYGAKTKLIHIEVPYQQLLRQNRDRTAVVPNAVLHKMIRKWEVPTIWEAPEVQFEVET